MLLFTAMKRFIRWFKFVVTQNHYPKRWQDRLLRGHLHLGPITLYGANAMHWALQIKTPWGFICAHPRTRTFGGNWPAYFYVSPDATPQSATFTLRAYRD